MNSTDPGTPDPRVRALFDRMTAIAQSLRADGREPFPMRPDPAAATYYTRRTATEMRREDFHVPACDSPEAFEKALVEYWKQQGLPELCELAPRIGALARDLCLKEEQADEVSPFVYAMF
jgi:hypothetical protein